MLSSGKMSNKLRCARSAIEIILLLIASVSGIIVAVCVSTSMGKLNDRCLLYATADYVKLDRFLIKFWSNSTCQFVIGAESLLAGLSIPFVVVAVVSLMKKTPRTSSFLPRLLTAMYALCWTFVLVSACVTTVGFTFICASLLERRPSSYAAQWPKTCKGYQDITWTLGDGSRFYVLLETAMVASWVSFMAWLCLPLVAWSGVFFVSRRPTEAAERLSIDS